MTNNLTFEEKEILSKYRKHTENISFPQHSKKLQAQLYLMWEANFDRFPTFSAFIREACACLLAHGVNWRDKQNDSQLEKKVDSILSMLENGVVVEQLKQSTNDGNQKIQVDEFFE